MYSWLLVLVFLMARGGPGGKRRRSSAQQPAEEPAEDVGSEYNLGEDAAPESQDEDWEAIATEVRSKKREQEKGKGKDKGKGKEKEKAKGKGKGKELAQEAEPVIYSRGQRKTVGISIREPTGSPRAQDVPIDPHRRSMYSSKHCIGERAVGVANLFEKVPGFQALFENGNLHEICDFPERTGYGLELVREFYMRAGHLAETDGGPYVFTTLVRGVKLIITPDTIGSVLEMPIRTDGIDYLNAGFDSVSDWKRVLTSLCVEGAENNGVAILSKDLKLEYRFLNFVVCYNIMPMANTKVIRWDRVLYMYLLGHPELVQQRNINLNVPFLIWRRMAKEIKTTSQKDRLPFSLLIMRILRLFEIDVTCSSYERSLGPISDTTIVKSHVQLRPHSPPHAPAPAPPSLPILGSDDDISLSSVYREQQHLSGELERLAAVRSEIKEDVAKLNKKYERISRFLQLLCEKMGCGSSEMPPPRSDSE